VGVAAGNAVCSGVDGPNIQIPPENRKGTLSMRKRLYIGVLTVCLLLGCGPITLAAENGSEIYNYIKLYGYELPQSVLDDMHAAFSPVAIVCGDIEITLSEMLYDGRMLYTAAYAVPIDPGAVLLFPGGAWLEDFVAGGYRENERDDNRTFLNAAREDGKRLLCVYVYPKEFDAVSEYFLDHFQRANDISVLYSGANISSGDGLIPVTWKIEIYEIDTVTGDYSSTLLDGASISTTIRALKPMETKRYIPQAEEKSPLHAAVLVKTGLTVYIDPEWKSEADIFRGYTMLDAAGIAYEKGTPPYTNTCTMDELPHELYILLDGIDAPLLLIAEEQ
jgi:hypothetical protein